MDNQIIFLKGKKVTLRPVGMDDLPLLMRWTNDPEVRQFIKRTFPVTEKGEKEWIESLSSKKNDIVFIIEAEGKAIGLMGIHDINWINGTATTGALIGEKDYWGKGYGTDAKMILLNYAFNTLNLRKICSRVKAFNERSLRYSLHCGYQIEGTLRKHYFTNGEYHDCIVLGLFKEEWVPYWNKYQEGESLKS